MNNTYIIEGQRRQVGAIGAAEPFQIEKTANSSRTAYLTVRNESYNSGYETILVTAIKMKCEYCGETHVTVDPGLYLR